MNSDVGGRLHRLSRWVVAISLVIMTIAGFGSNVLLNEDEFASLIAKSVDSEEVRKLLATEAVDIAVDASNADALLADALPEEYSLVASPALELSKPALAQVGTQLLGLDAVGTSLETAARSIHRQTASAIVDDQDVDVVINTLPVLVVVADEIAGDLGARAAVGVNLPESATSINLGSNQGVFWKAVRSLNYVAAFAVAAWLVAMVVYFATAGRGRRVAAVRPLGYTYVRSGIALAIISWAMLVIVAIVIDIALSPDDALSFGEISLGSSTTGGGAALAEAIFDPLLGMGRRTVFTGVAMIVATYLFGRGALAKAARQSFRDRNLHELSAELRAQLPMHVGTTGRVTTAALATLLILWPQITMRAALTLVAIAIATLMTTAVLVGTRAPAPAIRSTFEVEAIARSDISDRTTSAIATRRALMAILAIVALIWPTYSLTGFVTLAVLASLAFLVTYRWEVQGLDPAAEAVAEGADDGWSLRRKLAIGGVVVLGIALVGLGGDNASPASAAALTSGLPQACNGHAALCDRPLDEVVFAGTHNSMSADELGWELANHEGAIPAQLRGRDPSTAHRRATLAAT